MKSIVLKHATQNTPFIYFDNEKGIFEIFGRMIFQNDSDFWNFTKPLLKYLYDYKIDSKPTNFFIFHIEYLDVLSEGIFYDIFNIIYDIKKTSECKITWYYKDELELELGYNIFLYFVDMPFDFVDISNNQ